jgi:serine/threonine protein kinase/Tol biopolymer transport system component
MAFTAGTKIDAYEILSLLGAGGMGEVYRARDSGLKRDVAIKVLPSFVSRDPDRLRRFTQEAQAAAALNHPNILAVHRLGTFEGSPYLVSELLEGETLREQLRHGAIPIRKATGYAVQIAHALAAAHEKGIVHRDLKPENLFVTKDGRIKILDFGLAKLMQSPPEPHNNDATQASATNPGTVMGTVGYMAPEQVRGEAVDHRADIFALGTVLYEMLTGKRAFARSTSAETMTAILQDDPPAISQAVKAAPPGLQRVVQRCLEKSPGQRFQSSSDLAFALEALSDSGSSPAVGIAPSSRPRWFWLVAAGVLAAAAVLAIAWWRTPHPVPVVESITQLTDDGQLKTNLFTDGSRIYFNEGPQRATTIAQVSVTGGSIAPVETKLPNPVLFGATSDGSTLLVGAASVINSPGDLFLLPLPAGEPRHLRISLAGALDLFPDGRVVFTTGNDVFIAAKDGSDTRKLVSFPGRVRDVEASPDGVRVLILRAPEADGTFDIVEIAADGTGLRHIRKGARGDCCFRWSADANHVLYISKNGNRGDIWAFATKGGLFRPSDKPMRLTTGPLSYSEAMSGHDPNQIFAVANKDRAELVRYDLNTREFATIFPGTSVSDLTYSDDGAWVAYSSYPEHSLWRSRSDGTDRMQLTYPPMEVQEPRISPDGTKVAFGSYDYDAFVVDVSGGEPRKIVAQAQFPVWSPDGRSLVLAKIHPDRKSFDYEIVDSLSGTRTPIPSSINTVGDVWIDNNLLLASTRDFTKLVTFNRKTGKWTDFLTGSFTNCVVTHDGKYVVLATAGPEPILQRLRVADHHLETLTALKGFTRLPHLSWTQLRVAADGSPIITRAADNSQIYALNVKWP